MEEPRRLHGEYILLEPLDRRSGPWRPWLALDAQWRPFAAVMHPALPGALDHLDVERLRRVRGPHVAGVHAVLPDDTDPAVVIVLDERFGTADLRVALLGARALAPVPALRLVRQVAEGLAVVHVAGFVHGRLDARSVLVDGDPLAGPVRVKLHSFGVASLNELPGARATPADDVRAVGALLTGLLTGTAAGGRPVRAEDVVAPAAVVELLVAASLSDEVSGPTAVEVALWARRLLADLGDAVEEPFVPPMRPAPVPRVPRHVRVQVPRPARTAYDVAARALAGVGALGVLLLAGLTAQGAVAGPVLADDGLRAVAVSAPAGADGAPVLQAVALTGQPTAVRSPAPGDASAPSSARERLLALVQPLTAATPSAEPQLLAAGDGPAAAEVPAGGSTAVASPARSASSTTSTAPTASLTTASAQTPTGAPSAAAPGTPTSPLSITSPTTPSGTPSSTPSSTPAGTPASSPSGAPSGTPSETATSAPTGTPTGTASGTPSVTPTATSSGTPISGPSGSATSAPSGTPTDPPAVAPTASASSEPTGAPTDQTGASPAVASDAPATLPSGAAASAPADAASTTPGAAAALFSPSAR